MALADTPSMAVFCDFENVAIGVRDANYEKFDIKPVLERLLLKGGIVVKKAYCDWERYKTFKATMHEANFELIEIPHVRQSGKNSADIRMVVDALDLCYTKAHVDTFVIISGDSDFSPLVSKLRENAKRVIGVGVKQSCSDLLISNCDEFIFYDDLVRDSQRANAARRDAREPAASKRPPSEDDKRKKEELEARKSKAIELAVTTFDALVAERGDSGKIWASLLKEAIKRRKPDFNESYYGFRAFGNLLEEAQARGLLEVGRDEKSNTWVYRAARSEAQLDAAAATAATIVASSPAPVATAVEPALSEVNEIGAVVVAASDRPAERGRGASRGTPRGRGRNGRGAADKAAAGVASAADVDPAGLATDGGEVVPVAASGKEIVGEPLLEARAESGQSRGESRGESRAESRAELRAAEEVAAVEPSDSRRGQARRGRGKRAVQGAAASDVVAPAASAVAPPVTIASSLEPVAAAPAAPAATKRPAKRKGAGKAPAANGPAAAPSAVVADVVAEAPAADAPARKKPAPRARRPRQTKAAGEAS